MVPRNSILFIECDPGLAPVADYPVLCSTNGIWQNANTYVQIVAASEIRCVVPPVFCNIPNVANGQVHGSSGFNQILASGTQVVEGTRVFISCANGYKSFDNQREFQCLSTGTFSNQQSMQCVRNQCQVPVIPNGYLTNLATGARYSPGQQINAMEGRDISRIDSIMLTCERDYTVAHNKTRFFCSADGIWKTDMGGSGSAHLMACMPIIRDSCRLPFVSNGNFQNAMGMPVQQIQHNQMATLVCNPGYDASLRQVRCANGQIDSTVGAGDLCQPQQCRIPYENNGNFYTNNVTLVASGGMVPVGTIVYLRCASTHYSSGRTVDTCSPGGTLQFGSCVEIPTPKRCQIIQIENGQYQVVGGTNIVQAGDFVDSGTAVTLACYHGYQNTVSGTAMCRNGFFQPPLQNLGRCEMVRRECTLPYDQERIYWNVAGGNMTGGMVNENEYVVVQCRSPDAILESQSCMSWCRNGKFEPDLAICRRQAVQPPSNPTCTIGNIPSGSTVVSSNGRTLRPGTTVPLGTQMTIRCPNQGQAYSPHMSTCRQNGVIQPPLQCIPTESRDCTVPIIENGFFYKRNNHTNPLKPGSLVPENGYIRLICAQGYVNTIKPEYAVCRNKLYSRQFGQCSDQNQANGGQQRGCPALQIDNGYLVQDANQQRIQGPVAVGRRVMLRCNQGFTSSTGNVPSTCEASGRYQPRIGTCSAAGPTWLPPRTPKQMKKTFCPNSNLHSVENGRIEDGESFVNATRLVKCNDGYRISGAAVVTCKANSRWTTPGTCVAIPEARNQEPKYDSIFDTPIVLGLVSFIIIVVMVGLGTWLICACTDLGTA